MLLWHPSVQIDSSSSQSPEHSVSPTTLDSVDHYASKSQNNTLPKSLEVSSLKGTEIDGLYPLDAQGNLVLSDDIKHRFEYFLSLMGEFPQEDIFQFVRDDIQVNLVEPALSQALKLFEDYIEYKQTLVALEAQLEAPADYEMNDIERVRSQLEQLRQLRREHLGDEAADVFFGFDDIYDDYMLSRIEIVNNRQLTEQEKQQQLSGLQDQLPQGLQEMRDETQRISHAFKAVESMKASGASEEEVFNYNSQQFGQDAAFRLKELEKRRAKWKQRIDVYLNEKQAIQSSDALNAAEKEDAIQMLSEEHFNETERKRLAAYE